MNKNEIIVPFNINIGKPIYFKEKPTNEELMIINKIVEGMAEVIIFEYLDEGLPENIFKIVVEEPEVRYCPYKEGFIVLPQVKLELETYKERAGKIYVKKLKDWEKIDE